MLFHTWVSIWTSLDYAWWWKVRVLWPPSSTKNLFTINRSIFKLQIVSSIRFIVWNEDSHSMIKIHNWMWLLCDIGFHIRITPEPTGPRIEIWLWYLIIICRGFCNSIMLFKIFFILFFQQNPHWCPTYIFPCGPSYFLTIICYT